MMADENKNEETVTAETQNAVTNEQPAVADTPSEAADTEVEYVEVGYVEVE